MAKPLPRHLELTARSSVQLGQALERHRARAGLTQTELAKSAGVRQATVSKVEQGAEHTEIETIFALCAALELEVVVRPRAQGTQDFHPEELF